MGHAARLFNGAAEDTLHNRVTPSQEQRERLQKHWKALADHLTRALTEESGYETSTWIQGSYKFGTLIKPVHKGEEYDVDLGLYFHWEPQAREAEPAPEQLRNWVQIECENYSAEVYDIERVVHPPMEHCSRLIYIRQFHVDVPVYHFRPSSKAVRLATMSKGWEWSDPEALYEWFKNIVGNPERDQLRRLIRYVKGWSAVTFAPTANARPSSVLLTVLSTEAFVEKKVADLELDDEDALYIIARQMLERISVDSNVPNPVDATENLNRIPERDFPSFRQRLQQLADAGERASQSADEAAAALAWADAFSYLMPLPEADVEIVDGTTGRALMTLPEIRIEVSDQSGRYVATFPNEVPSVAKGCTLKFSIINPAVVPQFATIDWTVRNHGDEAEQIGDLGHRNLQANGLEATEQTRYFGRHFMDCVIRVNGVVYAVRRVPVHIRPAPPPAIHRDPRG